MRTVWTAFELLPPFPVENEFAVDTGGQLLAAGGQVGIHNNLSLFSLHVLLTLAALVHSVGLKLVLEVAFKVVLGEI